MALAAGLLNELSKTAQQLEKIEAQNKALIKDLERLNIEHAELKSRLQKQKLLTLEAKTGLVRIEDVDDTIVLALWAASLTISTSSILRASNKSKTFSLSFNMIPARGSIIFSMLIFLI